MPPVRGFYGRSERQRVSLIGNAFDDIHLVPDFIACLTASPSGLCRQAVRRGAEWLLPMSRRRYDLQVRAI